MNHPEESSPPWLRGILWAVPLILLGLAWTGSIRDVVLRFMPDDGFYYLSTAQHLGLGLGSTSDGVTSTNGYHPLWTLVLAPFAPLLQVPALGSRVAFSLGIVMLGGAAWLAQRVVRTLQPDPGGMAGGMAAMGILGMLALGHLYGMESPLACLLLVGMVALLPASPERGLSLPTPALSVGIGLISGLLVLSRLDAVVYVVALDALWLLQLVRLRSREGWRGFLLAVALQGLMVGGYLLVNWMVFGHPLTVSARIKTARQPGLNLDWLKSTYAILAVLSTALTAGLALKLGRKVLERPLALPVLMVGQGLHLLGLALKGTFETYNWYFALPLAAGMLLLPVVDRELLDARRLPGGLRVGWLVVALCTLVNVQGRLLRPSAFLEQYERGVWMAQHTPSEAIFAEPDSGILNYFAQRPVINTDGLSSSFDLQEAIRDDQLVPWLQRVGVSHLVLAKAYKLEVGPDGTAQEGLVVRKGMTGHERFVRARIRPEPDVTPEAPYRLWKIEGLEPSPVPVPNGVRYRKVWQ